MLSSLSSTIRTVLAIPALRLPQQAPGAHAEAARPAREAPRDCMIKTLGRYVTERQTDRWRKPLPHRPRSRRKAGDSGAYVSSPRTRTARARSSPPQDRPGQIRAAAAEPGFLAGVLDHICGDERCSSRSRDDAGIDPADDRARAQPRLAAAPWERGTCRERLLPRLPRRRVREAAALRGLRLAAARPPRRTRHALDRAYRLRRLLRHDREARRSLARRQAGDRRRRQARRGRRPPAMSRAPTACARRCRCSRRCGSARTRPCVKPNMAKYVARRPRGARS